MMSHSLTLTDLVAQLTLLGEWGTARGPRHPTEPDPHLAPEITRFWAAYPFLRRDSGYVDFLEQYAGAHLLEAATSLAIELPDQSYRAEANHMDIFGFSHTVSLHIVENDADDLPIIDADGFLQVAILSVTLYKLDASLPGDSQLYADKPIAFDATGKRPWGIYAKTTGPAEREPIAYWSMPTYQRCWATFLEFLVAVVTRDVLSSPFAQNLKIAGKNAPWHSMNDAAQ